MTLKSQTPATWKIHVLLCIAIISLSLKLISGEWIDEDTPMGKRVTKSMVDGTDYHLVSLLSISLFLWFLFLPL